MKLHNYCPGIKIKHSHITHKPPSAVFTIETLADDLRSVQVLRVPLKHLPTSRSGYRRALQKARRKLYKGLEVGR